MSDLISKAEVLSSVERMMETYWDRKQILSIVRNAIEKLPSAEPKWIPVTERLPDPYTAVLVSDGKYVWVDSLEDEFNGNGNYVVWWDSSNSVDFDKTAWMPLPELFRGDDK